MGGGLEGPIRSTSEEELECVEYRLVSLPGVSSIEGGVCGRLRAVEFELELEGTYRSPLGGSIFDPEEEPCPYRFTPLNTFDGSASVCVSGYDGGAISISCGFVGSAQ